MKKALSLLLCFLLLLGLCACGGKETPEAHADAPAAAPTDAPVDTPVTPEVPADAPAQDVPEEPAEEDPVEIVRGYIDQPIEDLYAVIGQPESSDYAPSCMGEGEDGMLFYDGFIVYTYREGETETVYDVE